MIPRGAHEIENGRLHGECDGEAVDQFAGVFSRDFRSEDFAGLGIREHADESAFRFHQNGFSVIVEWIRRAQKFSPRLSQLLFRKPGGRDLRIGECDLEQMIVMDRLNLMSERVLHGDLRLGDRDMDNFMRAAAVAGRIDMGIAGLLKTVGRDAPGGCCANTRGIKPQQRCARPAPQGV